MKTLEDAVKEIWVWQYDDTNSYYTNLIRLYRRADKDNKRKLDLAYPQLGLAIQMWEMAGDNGNDLFRSFGLNVPKDHCGSC